MFVLKCKMIIGDYKMETVTAVKIKKSIHSFVDTALITLPASSRLKTSTTNVPESVPTPARFQEGNKVEIWLGYDQEDALHLEFTGFVRRVNAATPCVIECEGYSWQLGRKNVHWSTGKKPEKLKDLLAKLVSGTDITLSSSIPDMDVQQISEGDISGKAALDWLKKNLYLTVYFSGKELYAGLAYLNEENNEKVGYQIGWNLVKDDELKFRKAEDIKLLVRMVSFNTRNRATKAEAGDSNGVVNTIFAQHNLTEAELKKMAEKNVKDLRYDGYEGKITGFLAPFALPGYGAVLKDPNYKEREGTYLIESTEVNFGNGGGRRLCELGRKISK
ncbi:hypothetical protein F0L74_00910 [Chitinophaga agrisoli]|uniref:Late control gene D protein (GPD) n=1 Tax=Chitinophaga agrisoli TaxID=2607653 RepID=A0A5B2W0V0_9BACT|nr:hypothetical protein [Chitinophaga agrisoli]KAA2244568.1 hypothetical protein F0L74_00910 [Chitinophaga agrisoli]